MVSRRNLKNHFKVITVVQFGHNKNRNDLLKIAFFMAKTGTNHIGLYISEFDLKLLCFVLFCFVLYKKKKWLRICMKRNIGINIHKTLG